MSERVQSEIFVIAIVLTVWKPGPMEGEGGKVSISMSPRHPSSAVPRSALA